MVKISDHTIVGCVGFYNVYCDIHNEINKPHSLDDIMNIATLSVPHIVNGAFACELALKSVLDNQTAKKLGHKLYNIFTNQAFPDEYRKAIINFFIDKGHSEDEFNKVLLDSSELFVKWRYYYEKGSITTPDNFGLLVDSICRTMIGLSSFEVKG